MENHQLESNNLQDILQEIDPYEETNFDVHLGIDNSSESVDNGEDLTNIHNINEPEPINSYEVQDHGHDNDDYSYIYSDLNQDQIENSSQYTNVDSGSILLVENLTEYEKDLLSYSWKERIVYYLAYPRCFLNRLYESIINLKWL